MSIPNSLIIYPFPQTFLLPPETIISFSKSVTETTNSNKL